MASKLGISTQDSPTGRLMWPGEFNEITNVRFSSQYGNGKPGGPSTFTCDVMCPSYRKPIAIAPGKVLRVWRGAENIWTGVINQPDTAGQGIGVTADGIGPAYGDRFVCTEKNNALFLNENIDAAISRGMPWVRTTAAPFYFGMMNPGATITDALNEITKQTGQEWSVSPTGLLTWSTPKTSLDYLLWAYGQGGARTLDDFGTDFYASYNPVEDVQIDKLDAAPYYVSGGTWSYNTTYKHGDSEGSLYCPGAGTGGFGPFATQPIDIRGYASVAVWVMWTSNVARDMTLTLVPNSGSDWNLGNHYMLLSPNVWTKRVFPLVDKPSSFSLTDWRGIKIGASGTLYVDDLWAISPYVKNCFGVFDPQITADQANVAGRNQYGRHEVTLDLTNQGWVASADATAAAQVAMTKYGYRPRWTQPFIASHHSLTTPRGVPVDLAGVQAGCRVRVMYADLGDDEIGATNSNVEFVVGQTDYDDMTDVLSLTPIDTSRKDLVTLLGKALPTGRKTKT